MCNCAHQLVSLARFTAQDRADILCALAQKSVSEVAKEIEWVRDFCVSCQHMLTTVDRASVAVRFRRLTSKAVAECTWFFVRGAPQLPFGRSCEGFSPQDLVVVMTRAVGEAWTRHKGTAACRTIGVFLKSVFVGL